MAVGRPGGRSLLVSTVAGGSERKRGAGVTSGSNLTGRRGVFSFCGLKAATTGFNPTGRRGVFSFCGLKAATSGYLLCNDVLEK